ncbi:MAG: VOC family protein [Rhodospirillaceae bacterium]|jgi:predicted enzyme related to lactoylglutathione lyase|nr:VOC family protein [Rhodospirillaceae bacterium]
MPEESILKRFAAARVFVSNVDKAARFYGDTLGLTISVESVQSVIFTLQNMDLIIEQADPTNPEGAEMIGRFTALSFAVEDCQSAVGLLTGKNVQFLAPAQKQAWGGFVAHFLDPEGNVLTLVEHPKEG